MLKSLTWDAISESGNVVQTTGSAKTGNVTAAASETGNVVQTSGTGNRVQVDQPKPGFWAQAVKKLVAFFMWIKSFFSGGA